MEAIRKAKSGVYVAKRKAPEEIFTQMESSDSKNSISKPAKRMKTWRSKHKKHGNQNIVGGKYVKNDEGCLA